MVGLGSCLRRSTVPQIMGRWMSKKFSAARKRAFLHYLAASGNQTISAERAKVSRSWVGLHRKEDAGFDAACREAIGAAKENLTAPPHPPTADAAGPSLSRKGRGANSPPSGWGFLDGAELVVKGSNDRRTQIARARAGQWTARVRRLDEVRGSILRKLDAIERGQAVSAEQRAADERAYRSRRPPEP